MVFSSTLEFERQYFLSLVKKPDAPAAGKNPISNLSPEEAKFLNAANFSTSRPFSGEKVDVEVTADKWVITKATEAKPFGKVLTELISKSVALDSLIHPEMMGRFKSIVADISNSKPDAVTTLALKAEKDELWIVEVNGVSKDGVIKFTLSDKTLEVAKILGKEGGADTQPEENSNKPVDLILFRYTMTPKGDAKRWVTKTAALLKKAKLWPAENRPKFIAVRYEDDPKEKSEFNHPYIDDLLCLPLDRLIFLQKMELTLALPKKNAPSFLFVQPADDPIEIAKKIVLERTNDLGFAISNPIPIAPGTPGHFYFRFPGQKPLLDVYGKVNTSIPHPEREGEYLVYFNFFGLTRNMNKEIRAYLARDSAYKPLLNQDPSQFRYKPENIFLSEDEKRRRTIAIIDADEGLLKNTSDYVKKEIGNIDLVSNDSYYEFFRRYIEMKAEGEKATAAAGSDFYAEFVSILIGPNDLNMQMTLTPPTETDLFLGHSAQKLFSNPQDWLDLFDIDARSLLTECLNLSQNTKRVQKLFELMHADGKKRTLMIEFILEDTSNLTRLNFKFPDARTAARTGNIARIESLECMLIDTALLPEDVAAFMRGLKEGAEKNGLRVPANGPRIIVMANENQKVNFDALVEAGVFGLVYKPLEARRILFLAAQAMSSPFTAYNFENIGWKSEAIPAKIARPARLIELSEFGATIRSPQPLKPNTMLYLFKSIFNNAPDQNLCVRVYHSEEDSANPGFHVNSVVYFGITDAFLKFTRSYIRETYASAKSKEGS